MFYFFRPERRMRERSEKIVNGKDPRMKESLYH